jgi:hypothetical protein
VTSPRPRHAARLARCVAFAVIAGALIAATPAHHSWSTHYDLTQSKQVSGTIAQVLMQSPHAALVLDVETDDGRSERWRVEWASPSRLRDRGVTAKTLRKGERLSVTGNPHRDPGTKSLHAESVRRMSDGREL